MTIMDMLRMIGKHWLTAVIVFIIVVGAAAGFTFTRTKQYTATAQMFASYNSVAADANLNNVGVQSAAGSYIATQLTSYPDLVKTSAVLQPVVEQESGDYTVGTLAGMVTATNPEGTYMLNVSVTGPDPQQSADLANSIAKSLSDVVASELYSSGEQSIVKLSVVQKAQTPSGPSSPNVMLNLLAGCAIGLVLAIVCAILRDLLSRRIQDISDLQVIAQQATIVGVIPKDDDLDGTKPIVVTKPDGSIAEEFRRIRTNLSFTTSKDGDKGRLIVVTSSMPSEGKTTISCNLAATLAENGAAVLLIDADLRHPSVAKRLGLEGNVGLAHVLSNQATVKDVVQRYWKPNLHILPAGPRIQNASVLLNSTIMHSLIKQAVQQYDYVIIDTTPMSVANDAAVFGQQGNGVVLVSGKGVTYKSALRGTVTELGELDVPILGFVFNLADQQKSGGYSSYYYYGSYYHYGEYGYGSEDADNGKQSKKKPAGKRGRK
ncbi:polysaccharide biosynthesis tyrosine autokinase [Bifidobacterium aesculapii]|uniref:polysaccharide biosynthesis tyrosine autokinase n=1 Tax=Bifidobacterium aesculapii TaxID=1329411 RepID=UPI0009E8C70F|nr:polysaccharide biosynthesis tyrosine autokinase [Bifidobacterium aesculapii]